ncbi:ribonuclease P protein component [Liberiplasma polymorphum]|jgi:ribonuclease P protein component|uniref:ribonuclease P protein component n=1 Tax=Liberiplasma polymorphum TaxID=3374570 RepID=UPI0037723D0D
MRLKKLFRVKKSQDIESIIKTRNAVRNKYFKLYSRKNHEIPYFRFAVSVPKKYGNAVNRNKVKRQLRMIVSQQTIQSNIDFFIIVNPEARSCSYQTLKESLEQLLIKQNIIEVKK